MDMLDMLSSYSCLFSKLTESKLEFKELYAGGGTFSEFELSIDVVGGMLFRGY